VLHRPVELAHILGKFTLYKVVVSQNRFAGTDQRKVRFSVTEEPLWVDRGI
jgi:hypothetical protein